MRLIDANALKGIYKSASLYSEFSKYEIDTMIDEQPTVDAVSKDLFEQYKWERDLALETLEEHGLSLGQKKRRGKWIESNPKKSKSCRLVECSECGNTYIVNINIPLKEWARGNKTFCGNCGAKMVDDWDIKEK